MCTCAFVVSVTCAHQRLYASSLQSLSCARRRVPKASTDGLISDVSTRGRVALALGGAGVICIALNRLLFTSPSALSAFQSRSDILAVISSVSLLVYGVGIAELREKRAAVQLDGVALPLLQNLPKQIRSEATWTAQAVLNALSNVKTLVVFLNGECVLRVGIFRTTCNLQQIVPGSIVANAINTGQRAYLADMKVVPTKEVEFSYLPQNCQVRHTSTHLF